MKSKTIAERAAWDFVEREGGALELSVINPVGVLGPILGPDYSTSIQLVQRLLDGALPGVPRLSFGIVDVRDVADLHRRAMSDPAARMGSKASRVPTRVLPDWLVRLASRLNRSLAPMISELGKVKSATNEKARRRLGWAPRPNDDAIIATAESLARLGGLRS